MKLAIPDMPTAPPPPPPFPSTPTRSVSRKTALIVGTVVVAIAAGIPLTLFALGSDERSAKAACTDGVLDQLKSPASADVQFAPEVSNVDGIFVFSGTVDAQNGFGALVRNNFECATGADGEDPFVFLSKD